jgi:hypothetical protein
MIRRRRFPETYKSAVVSTMHLPEDLAQSMQMEELQKFIYESTQYGFRLWTGCGKKMWPKEIRPIMGAAKDAGLRWVDFDEDGPEAKGFATWDW